MATPTLPSVPLPTPQSSTHEHNITEYELNQIRDIFLAEEQRTIGRVPQYPPDRGVTEHIRLNLDNPFK